MKRCAHEGCDCPIPPERAERGDEFCSDYCEKHMMEGHQRHACDCGHPNCKHQ